MSEDPRSWDDLTLATRCAARENPAWEELLRRVGPAARHIMARVFRNAGLPAPLHEAEEAMGAFAAELLEQDARVLRAYRPPTPLRTYLGVIAHRLACRILRKRHPNRSLEDKDLSWVPDTSADVQQVDRALQQLDAQSRLALQMIYWKGLRYEQAARVLGVPLGTFGPLVTRAREALRRLLR